MAYSVVHIDEIEGARTIFRFDPETTRQIVAGADGCTMIAVGARRGAYEPRGPF